MCRQLIGRRLVIAITHFLPRRAGAHNLEVGGSFQTGLNDLCCSDDQACVSDAVRHRVDMEK